MSPDQRSKAMSRVRSKDTKPELSVRRLLKHLGYRYRLHVGKLPGKPDIVIGRLHKVIFVHGCFWHRHPGCSKTTTPQTRTEFWQAKFDSNVERDVRHLSQLYSMGWKVLVIWECELADEVAMLDKLKNFLEGTDN